ncbi:MAG: glycosyltransferase family 2 protein [Candidatus Omnitrophica bacterium]|nr:glycosyltransferase family 2 protein [Candidatus Omnitrophota bacterium]
MVSIIIPHWSPPGDPKGREALVKCLDSISRQVCSSLEVIVVNNEGEGAWTEEVEKKYPKARWIHNPENRFFTGALNQGISAARGEWVLSINNDVVLSGDFIEKLIQGVPADGKIGMACGLLLRDEGGIIDSAGQSLSLAKNPHERGHGEVFRGQYQKIEEVFSLPGACGLYRRRMLEDIALGPGEYFDSGFGLFYEDLELAWRGRKKKWRALFVPEAVAYHVRGLTTKSSTPRWPWLGRFHAAHLNPENLDGLIRNRRATLRRHCHWLQWLLHWPWIIAYDLGLYLLRFVLTRGTLIQVIFLLSC